MRNWVLKIAVAAAVLPFTLAGCATFHQAHVDIHQSNAKVSRELTAQRSLKSGPIISTVNTPYLLGAVVRVAHQHSMPSIFEKSVHLATSQPLSLGQFATQITQMTGVPIHVASQVTGYLQASEDSGSMGSVLPGLPGQEAVMALPNESRNKDALSINWNGSLTGLLNLVAARTGTFWEYRHGAVRFFLTKTRSFSVDALPGTTGFSASITNTGSDGGSSGGSSGGSGSSGGGSTGSSGSTNQAATVTTSLDIYKSIQAGVKSVLTQSQSAGGGSSSAQVPTSVSVNESTGQVIVTASPPELHAVAAYIRQINEGMRKNVLINVHVYSVTLNQANNYNLDLNAAFNSLGSGASPLKLQGPQSENSVTGQGSLSAGIVTSAVNAQMVASALATQGNVSLVTSGSVIALNGQPTPMQVAHMHSYVASSATTQTANVGSSTTVTPGQFTTGFSATFLPLIRNKRILLEYTINLTQNLGLQTFASGTSSVQLPNLAMQAFMQRVAIRSGQTLVLSGFEQTNSQTNHDGIGGAHFWGLGGGASAIHDRSALVVVIHVVKLGD